MTALDAMFPWDRRFCDNAGLHGIFPAIIGGGSCSHAFSPFASRPAIIFQVMATGWCWPLLWPDAPRRHTFCSIDKYFGDVLPSLTDLSMFPMIPAMLIGFDVISSAGRDEYFHQEALERWSWCALFQCGFII